MLQKIIISYLEEIITYFVNLCNRFIKNIEFIENFINKYFCLGE